jgi:hypothetical protein
VEHPNDHGEEPRAIGGNMWRIQVRGQIAGDKGKIQGTRHTFLPFCLFAKQLSQHFLFLNIFVLLFTI